MSQRVRDVHKLLDALVLQVTSLNKSERYHHKAQLIHETTVKILKYLKCDTVEEKPKSKAVPEVNKTPSKEEVKARLRKQFGME